jgi:hypothetical protein
VDHPSLHGGGIGGSLFVQEEEIATMRSSPDQKEEMLIKPQPLAIEDLQLNQRSTLGDFDQDQNVYLTTELIKQFPDMSASSSIIMNDSQQTDGGHRATNDAPAEGNEMLLNHQISTQENLAAAPTTKDTKDENENRVVEVRESNTAGSLQLTYDDSGRKGRSQRTTESQKRRRSKGDRRQSSSLKRRLKESERLLIQSRDSLHHQSSSTILQDMEGEDLQMEYYAV